MVAINNKIGSALGNYSRAKGMSRYLEQGFKHPGEIAAKAMLWSLVSKDFINCIIYTTQSLNNKKIPEDKRRFVGYMDLINGVINVAGQIGSFFLVDHFLTPKLKSLFSGVNEKDTEGVIRSKSTYSGAAVMKRVADTAKAHEAELKKYNLTAQDVVDNLPKLTERFAKKFGSSSTVAKEITTGVGIVVGALATTALIKRTITPLFATPLAGKLADKVTAKKAAEKEAMTPEMVNSTMPKVATQDNKPKFQAAA